MPLHTAMTLGGEFIWFVEFYYKKGMSEKTINRYLEKNYTYGSVWHSMLCQPYDCAVSVLHVKSSLLRWSYTKKMKIFMH